MTDFQALGLSDALLRAIDELGFEQPTPIQEQAIPLALEGRDVLGLAQTGTGKTAAFSLPLIDRLRAERAKPAPRSARALILAPTRELANQIADSLRAFSKGSKLRVVVVVGGASINNQIRMLERGADILVATPGRLLDLIERRAVTLSDARALVLDEADQMLDLGFVHALRRIAKLLPSPRQTLLFSATMPKAIGELAGAYLTDPVRVEATPPGKAADKIDQSVLFLQPEDKLSELRDRLASHRDERALVFARTKRGAEKLSKTLIADGFKAASIHGNKSQGQRDRAIAAFRSAEVRVLVATDVAARGIDIPGVAYVYNYELPDTPDNYVHRIGRTARAGADGEAVAFCTPDEAILLRDIERLMKIEIASTDGAERPEWALRPRKPAKPAKPGARGGGGARNGQRNGARGGPAKPRGPAPARSARNGAGDKPRGDSPRRADEGGATKPRRFARNRRRKAAGGGESRSSA